MDHEIAFVQLAEIDLGAIATQLFGLLETATAMGRVATEQFRAGKHDQLAIRKNESARERSFQEINPRYGVPHDFAEPFDLAFGLEINRDPKFRGAPVAQTGRELGPFRFDEHEVADGEITDV